MNKFMIVVLLSSFGAIEASNLPPNLGSLSITKTLECLLPVGDTVRPEALPLIPLVPGMHLCCLGLYPVVVYSSHIFDKGSGQHIL